MTTIRLYIKYKARELFNDSRAFVKDVQKPRTWWYMYIALAIYCIIMNMLNPSVYYIIIAVVALIFTFLISLYVDYKRGYHIGWYRKRRLV